MFSTVHGMTSAVLAAALLLNTGPGQEQGAAPAQGALAPRAAFEQLKALGGRWQGSAEKPGGDPMSITYELTGNGSAVMERLFAGTPHEMLSVYFMDGEDLVLTHYCAAANQPRMKLVKATSNPTTLTFDYVGGTNIDPAKDMHIHGGQIRILSKDQMEADWLVYAQGKQSGTHKAFVTRK